MRHLRLGLATAIVATLGTAPGTAAASSGDDRPFPTRVFAASSPFYQRLPADTPTAPDSDALVAGLVQQAKDHYGTPSTPTVDISTSRWTPTMYVARSSDPVPGITTNNCQAKPSGWDRDLVNDHFKDVHIPADAVPDDSTDGSMVVYNPDTDTVTETWVTHRNGDGSWTACFGGTIRDAGKGDGVHRGFYGVSGSGISLAATTIRPEELAAGHIDHVVALNIPDVKAGGPSWPAVRSDGHVWGTALAEGQLLRLPASLDIDALRLSPAARTIAKAAQEYGIVVTDRAGAVTFIAQNSSGRSKNPYGAIFRGRWAGQEMAGDPARGERSFPLGRLVALPMNHRVQGAPAQPTPTLPQPASAGAVVRQGTAWWGDTATSAGTFAGRTGATFDSKGTTVRPWYEKTSGTSVPELYGTTSWGQHRYGVDLPNGTYSVTLYQQEDYWSAPGKRVFDVRAEGRTELSDVDVFARTGGRYRADEPSFDVQVSDGRLDLEWVAKVDNPLVSGIRIVRR